MVTKMFNENNEIEIVEIGSERHKQLNFIADNAIKEIEIRALKKENKQLKEQLAIREKALELACIELCYDGNITDLSYREEYYIQQAKESMK